jgi:hypothetical protein
MARYNYCDRIAGIGLANSPDSSGIAQCSGNGKVAGGVAIRDFEQSIPDGKVERRSGPKIEFKVECPDLTLKIT